MQKGIFIFASNWSRGAPGTRCGSPPPAKSAVFWQLLRAPSMPRTDARPCTHQIGIPKLGEREKDPGDAYLTEGGFCRLALYLGVGGRRKTLNVVWFVAASRLPLLGRAHPVLATFLRVAGSCGLQSRSRAQCLGGCPPGRGRRVSPRSVRCSFLYTHNVSPCRLSFFSCRFGVIKVTVQLQINLRVT